MSIHSNETYDKAIELTVWLSRLPRVKDAKPTVVTFNKTSYPASIYKDESGVKIYVLAPRPKKLRSRANYCFLDKHGNTIYITAYCNDIKPEFAQFHPFGQNMILGIWPTSEMGEIDQYENFQYPRVPISYIGTLDFD